MPYTADKPSRARSADELRSAIPGWGVDRDPADRPSYPKEQFDPSLNGANWVFPERQPDDGRREKSIEHRMMTPVFGTSAPLHGVSGAIRRFAYRYSEGRAAHWLILLGADRVDAAGSHLQSLLTARPDNPITETGILGEPSYRPVSSRFGRQRTDTAHQWMDPILVAGPWLLAGAVTFAVLRGLFRR